MTSKRDLKINFPRPAIEEYCRRWKITELALFGSVLREDFRPDSDIDVLVSFVADAGWSLLDSVVMEQELEAILGRKVDMVTRSAVERSKNWIRKREILGTAHVLYAA